MANDTALSLVLVLVAVALLMQGGAMIVIWLAIKRIHRDVEGVRADVKQRLDPLARAVADILADSREPVRSITTNLAEISGILRDRAGHVDSVVADLVDKSRLQIIRVDQLVSDVMDKVETTTDAVQRQVLAPVQELSAVIKGVRAGLDFLFSRRRTASVSGVTQDEQMFI